MQAACHLNSPVHYYYCQEERALRQMAELVWGVGVGESLLKVLVSVGQGRGTE